MIRQSKWLVICALLTATLCVHGQEARGTLLGRVSDTSDAVIAGASVRILNVDTGVHFTSVTNKSGDYTFSLLVPGTYTVNVEHSGFKSWQRTGIAVRVNDQVAINATLEVGQASQTVLVSAETPLLDTSSASIGHVVDSRTILE